LTRTRSSDDELGCVLLIVELDDGFGNPPPFELDERFDSPAFELDDGSGSQGLEPSQLEIAAFPDSERFNAEAESGSGRVPAKSVPYDMDNVVAWNLPFVKTWKPSGTLMFYDEQFKKAVPLVGVRVSAGYRFYWRSDKTNSSGYFQIPEKWTLSVTYEANFDSQQFLLQDGHSWYGEDLDIEKKNTKSAWNATFTGNHAKWCVVWTAAYNYWYGDIYGLKRPRQNGWFNHSLEINVYYKNATDWNKYVGLYSYGLFLENIKILVYGKSHLEIYGITTHEIAHSSHYENGKNYTSLTSRLKESYAMGIERYLTLKHYGAWGSNYNNWKDDGETGLFEDLEDTDAKYARNSYSYCDKVGGITVPMAEKVLFKSDSWSSFKNNLMKEYPNGTSNDKGGKVTYLKADMDALFDFWETGKTSYLVDYRDGKAYRTTTIGTQTWMAENLNYNASGSKCYVDYNSISYCTTYGRLYNWSTAMALPSSCNSASCQDQVNEKHKGACPAGWHVPSVADWDKLLRYVDGDESTYSNYDSPTGGTHLKAESGWGDISEGKDTYGFSGLPGGFGRSDSDFTLRGYNGDWWSTSEYDDGNAYRFDLYYNGNKAGWEDNSDNRKHAKSYLFSIRCVQD
jgi:uncharacterized protein (TIGR02145 family)